MTVALALGACAPTPSPSTRPTPMEGSATSVRFANDAPDYVHVYLVGDQRQWLLGRVDPGAVATLRVPDESLGVSSGRLRLAVIAGESPTLQAARNPRVTFAVPQPAAAVASQQWRFADGQLSGLWLPGARLDVGRR